MNDYNTKQENHGGLLLICVLLMMAVCVAAAVGVFSLSQQNKRGFARRIRGKISESD